MHKSGYIAISRLRAWIVDEVYISKKNIQIHIFPIPTQHFLTLTIACRTTFMPIFGHQITWKYTKLTVTQQLFNESILFLGSINSA